MIAALTALVLIAMVSSLVGSKFVRAVLFLVYLGGLIILIRYCVILIPKSKIKHLRPIFVAGFFLSINTEPIRPLSYGLLYNFNVVLMLVLYLYLVMLIVVGIVDYSSGMLKYVISLLVFGLRFMSLYLVSLHI